LLPRADVHHRCTVDSEGVMGINASPKSIGDFGWMNPDPTADPLSRDTRRHSLRSHSKNDHISIIPEIMIVVVVQFNMYW